MTKNRSDVFYFINQERIRQEELKAVGKFKHSCADPIGNETKLAILTEELGEVAREVCEGSFVLHPNLSGAERVAIAEKLKTELIQVAAVAVAWLESFEQ